MRWLDNFINNLDCTVLELLYRGVGTDAYHPLTMLKLGLQACLEGRPSPAQWAKLAADSRSTQWLVRGIRPSRTCCYDFRDRLGAAMEDLASQVVRKAIEDGLVDPQIGIQDGTALRAAASRHRVVNRVTLQQRQDTLAQAIQQDEQLKPVEGGPQWMAKTPGGRLEQQQRFKRAAEVLAQRHEENNRRRKDRRLAENKVQVSLSEPEAPLGRDKEKVFCPLYTPQLMVEPSSLLILSYEVFSQNNDAGTLPTMADKTRAVLGHPLNIIIADKAYATLLDLRACAERGIELIAGSEKPEKAEKDHELPKQKKNQKPPQLNKSLFTWLPEERTYLCPEGNKLELFQKARVERRGGDSLNEQRFRCPPQYCLNCPLQLNCTSNPQKGRIIKRLEGQELLDAHAANMKTERAKSLYKTRGQVIERAFADIKQHRNGRRLHGRGESRAQTEVGLYVIAQNLLSIMRLQKKRESAANIGT